MNTVGETNAKGFVRSLYDFKFESLVATRWMRFIYATWVVLLTISAAIGVIASLAELGTSPAAGLLLLIVVLVYYVVWLIIIRVVVEIVIAFFRIGEDVRAIRLRIPVPADEHPVTVPMAAPATTSPGIAHVSSTPGDTAVATQSPIAGWYGAPGDPTRYRYWDGSAWTDQYQPRASN